MQQEAMQQLLGMDLGVSVKDQYKEVEIARLIHSINLLGTIRELPKAVEEVKRQVEVNNARALRAKKAMED